MAGATLSIQTLGVNGLRMQVAMQGSGPLVLLCHGFPELWISWREQLNALAAAGYRAVGPDMRGYGGTSAPDDVTAYSQLHLVGDMVELVRGLKETRAVIVGHDWGAPAAWNAALLRPDVFRAVVGMSVPFAPPGRVEMLSALRQAGIHDFYLQYFQTPGLAEAELERDVGASIDAASTSVHRAKGKPCSGARCSVPSSRTKVDEFLAALGRGDVGQRDLVSALQELGKALPVLTPTSKPRVSPKSGNPVVIPGLGDVPLMLARCCMPQPPEPIVAYTTVGRGVTVHRAVCASLKRANPARVMPAEWVLEAGAAFEVNIQLKAFDRQGHLRDVSDVIAKDRLDVLRVNTESRGEYAHMQLTVRVKELQQLSRLLSRLQHVQNVIEVRRG